MTAIQVVGVAAVVLGLLVSYLSVARHRDAARARELALRMELADVQRCIIRGREAAALGNTSDVVREIDAASRGMLHVAIIINGLEGTENR